MVKTSTGNQIGNTFKKPLLNSNNKGNLFPHCFYYLNKPELF